MWRDELRYPLRSRRGPVETSSLLLALTPAFGCSEPPRAITTVPSEGGAPTFDAGSAGGGTPGEVAGGGAASAGETAHPNGGRAFGGATSAAGEGGHVSTGTAGETASDAGGGAGGHEIASGGESGEHGADECELRYTEGHGDLFIGYDAGLEISIRSAFGRTSEHLVDPARVCVIVPAASHALSLSLGGAPEGEEFAFLGLAAGEGFWMLPASPRPGMPWFGAATEAIPSGLYASDRVVLSITQVNTPIGGNVSVFATDPLGAPSLFYSTVTGARTHAFPSGAHLHFDWAFTLAGTYTLTFRAEGEHRGGLDESADTSVRFEVLSP
jgi:surface-anchored protein